VHVIWQSDMQIPLDSPYLAGWFLTHVAITLKLFLVVILVKLSAGCFSTMNFPVYVPFL